VSIEAMTWVLGHSEETLGRRLVLLALANYAWADGSNAFPAVATLARDARMSERQVQRALRGMEADGSISGEGKSSFGTTIWTVRMTGGDNLSGVTNRAENRPEMSPDPSYNPSVEEELRSPSSFEIAREAFASTSDTAANGNPSPSSAAPPPRGGETQDEPRSDRRDVDSLCMKLAGLMLRNDPKAKIPKTASAWKRWQDAARLLIDADERHFEEAAAVLEWTQADDFEKANIHSMPKFRERYPQLRMKWAGSRGRAQAAVATHQQPSTADLMAAYERRDAAGGTENRRRRAGVR
jgi:hypothetical protein